ncbi:hypothetical protein ABNX05_05155 [Lysinibacillus sp. M3]|uniref:Uncharacterized protein n=1 Tax=Lysinibacillus zambalensis TaxID=3160866 RepID=A0ABV1MN99_9BACI
MIQIYFVSFFGSFALSLVLHGDNAIVNPSKGVDLLSKTFFHLLIQ